MIRVYTGVIADLLHIGHIRCLEQAKALGDYLIVGVLTDEAATKWKRSPIIPFEERMELVASLKCVDEVVQQDSVDATENLKRIKPDIFTHADDWNEEFFPGRDYMLSIGEKVALTKYYPGTSTTEIIDRIRRLYQ